MTKSRVIAVLGTHRSGTSAVAGSLARGGISFGDHLLPANSSNELGYFEDAELVASNEGVLARFGMTWHDPRCLPDGWTRDARVAPLRDSLKEALQRRLATDHALGIKDPRLSLLLPLYQEVLAELGAELRCLVVLRHPMDTSLSLGKRDGFPEGKALLLWLRDNLLIEQATRREQRLLVRFERVIDDWRQELGRAFAAWRTEAPPPGWEAAVAAGLRGDLCHHRSEQAPAHPWLVAAFASLSQLCRDDRQPAAMSALDSLHQQLRLATQLFGSAIHDLAARLEHAHAALGIGIGAPLTVMQRLLLEDVESAMPEVVRQLTDELVAVSDERDAALAQLQAAREAERYAAGALHETRSSLAWRASGPVRGAIDLVRGRLRPLHRLRRLVTKDRLRAGLRLVRAGRLREAWLQAQATAQTELRERQPPSGPDGFAVPPHRDPYAVHCQLNRLSPRRRRWLEARLEAEAGALPLVSVLMPIYQPPPRFLELAVRSVQAQVHHGWELILCDDASPSAEVQELLQRLAAADARIRLVRRQVNGGIAAATNTAAEAARGELLVFLDQDDLLAPDALAELALAAADPAVDVVYSDDDKVDAEGNRYAPQFKPDFSPELLLSFSYFSHAFAVRRPLFAALHGLRSGFDGAQDYDLMLRASERARRVAHVPRVLYHWRAHSGSTALDGRAKAQSFDAGRRAVADAFARRGVEVEVGVPDWAQALGCGIYEPRFPDSGPRVAIVIPSRNRVDLLRRCVQSIESQTSYQSYEIVLVDNESDDADTVRYFATTPHRVLRVDNPRGGSEGFSYAAVNNRAVEQVDAELVLLLNNDTEVRSKSWLSQMVGYLALPGVGAVGARLLLPGGRLQHAGVVQGLYERMAGPAFKLLPSWDGGHLSLARVARNCSAVTAAAMLVPRRTFLELGGFDERHFAVAYNDADFCHRLRAEGRRVVYCPGAELMHIEGGSRGTGGDRPTEEAHYRARYWQMRDPYYNPNLSLANERFEVRAAALALDPGRPIRCVMVAFNLNAEGASNSQFELTLALRARGVLDPVVFSPYDGPLRAEYERRGIEVVVGEHPMLHVHSPAFLEERVRQFARRLRVLGAEVVYANTLQSHYAVLAARSAGVPAVWNVRESEPWRTYFDFLAPPLRPLALGAFEAAYAVVFVSAATMQAFAELDSRSSFRVIRNGLDPARAEQRLGSIDRAAARRVFGFADSDVVFLVLGTVCARKGQLDAVEAFAALTGAAAARSQLLVVGDRPSAYSEQLHAAIAALPPERRRRVHVEAEREDVGAAYRAADVFLLTSRLESYPRVVLEAMYVGLPIVSTPVFGVTEQLREGTNALLYPPGDIAALAKHLHLLVRDDALRRRLGEKSRHVLDALPGFEQMVEGYAEVLREAWSVGDVDHAEAVDGNGTAYRGKADQAKSHQGKAHRGEANHGTAHDGKADQGTAHDGKAHQGTGHHATAHDGTAHRSNVDRDKVPHGKVDQGEVD